jgi:hypothetical protein
VPFETKQASGIAVQQLQLPANDNPFLTHNICTPDTAFMNAVAGD